MDVGPSGAKFQADQWSNREVISGPSKHKTMSEPIRVGIGLVGRAGYYLTRQRPDRPGSPMPGYWEFPGGKCEPGETPAAATRRECWEEAGLRVAAVRTRKVIIHQYAHGLVELHYIDCACDDPSAEPAADSGFRWVAAEDLPSYRFPEANEAVVAELALERSQISAGESLSSRRTEN
jgi:8-oxo-dGTP diphosphatase